MTVEESVCCHEQPKVMARMAEKAEVECVTQHPDFEAVCLNEAVLETAYWAYQHHYGEDHGNEYVYNVNVLKY